MWHAVTRKLDLKSRTRSWIWRSLMSLKDLRGKRELIKKRVPQSDPFTQVPNDFDGISTRAVTSLDFNSIKTWFKCDNPAIVEIILSMVIWITVLQQGTLLRQVESIWNHVLKASRWNSTELARWRFATYWKGACSSATSDKVVNGKYPIQC